METLLFYLFSFVAVLCALTMISSKKAIVSAVNMVVVMFSIAGLFALQNAHLLAALQILVYAGAIMVLFLFVIMLLNIREKGGLLGARQPFLQLIGVMVITALFTPLVSFYRGGPSVGGSIEGFGTTASVGRLLFTEYLLPFEIASVLLLAALVGAVILTKNRAD